MIEKQIIIDDIDVSGCAYIIPPRKQCPNKPMPYAKETSCFACKEHNTKLNFCKNNPNCYYKQLKAKEQECEKLKNQVNSSANTITRLVKKMEEYEKEYKRLEDENKILHKLKEAI